MLQTPANRAVALDTILPVFLAVRHFSEVLCESLELEDYVVQSMPEASPIRWHLAHTSWFFETFVLKPYAPGYQPVDPAFEHLFNSYYNGIGQPFPRSRRGLMTRPTVAEVLGYRKKVDDRMAQLLLGAAAPQEEEIVRLVELGLHHEQQHQELMLTDLKHAFAQNPLYPVYRSAPLRSTGGTTMPERWRAFEGGIVAIGHATDNFAYDNESPRHECLLRPFELAVRLVTNEEYLRFIEHGGYQRPELWLSLGWEAVQEKDWQMPLYWVRTADGWHEFTLGGLQPLVPNAPVTHISYFEADAFARWADCRLATESEWEEASRQVPLEGNFVESEHYHPQPVNESAAEDTHPLQQMLGDCWEWTSSPYTPYPGYRPPPGAIGEYNGKFMCNQYVLRGGSCATPQTHIRRTYRNFFPPEARWQFSGIRLARDT